MSVYELKEKPSAMHVMRPVGYGFLKDTDAMWVQTSGQPGNGTHTSMRLDAWCARHEMQLLQVIAIDPVRLPGALMGVFVASPITSDGKRAAPAVVDPTPAVKLPERDCPFINALDNWLMRHNTQDCRLFARRMLRVLRWHFTKMPDNTPENTVKRSLNQRGLMVSHVAEVGEAKWLKYKNFGRKSIHYLQGVLDERGYRLAP